ncbi:MAG: transporter substrate-binding domain-containing protein [Clostridia bacterium]|nr:transporter substrate-binding domain-containing protein [Clostridia bacterium]
MKRIITLMLAVVFVLSMAVSFSACGEKSDWETVKEQGYFVCGITVYAPMNYFDDDGNLTGFDTEFAEAVAKELGVEAKFQVISWPNKYMELDSGAIDLIWNGFTYGLESDGVARTEYVDFTYSYLENRQCLVTKADRVEELNSADALKGKKAVAEGGSSGEGVANELTGEDNVTTFTSQASALMELIAGNADFAVIDYQMANAMVGKGDYASLSINNAIEPESEVYAIGCRKGSDLTAKINEAIKTLYENGTMATIAAKYKLTNDLVTDLGAAE